MNTARHSARAGFLGIPSRARSLVGMAGWVAHLLLGALSLQAADAVLGRCFYLVEDLDRQRVHSRGSALWEARTFPENLILAPRTRHRVSVVQALTGRLGQTEFVSGENGSALRLPNLAFIADISDDADVDGLPSASERVIGSRPDLADTDGDGLNDGEEVRRGLNPVDGLAVTTGILGVTPLPGVPTDLAVGEGYLAAAVGLPGVVFLDLKDPLRPARVATVDTPGEALRVAAQGRWVAVADGNAGCVILDAVDPAHPVAIATNTSIGRVERVWVNSDQVFAGGSGGTLAMLRAADGGLVDVLPLGPLPIAALGGYGRLAFVAEDNQLFAIDVIGGTLQVRGRSVLEGRLFDDSKHRFFADADRMWIGTFGGIGLYRRTSAETVNALGSLGLGLRVDDFAVLDTNRVLAITYTSGFGTAGLGLYEIAPDAGATTLLGEIPLAGAATALAVRRGLAYVLHARDGLLVVNFAPLDTQGQPPVVSVRATEPGSLLRLEAGSDVDVEALASDDVLVSRVEFYADGALVQTREAFPFAGHFGIPPLDQPRTNLTLEARAYDLAGRMTQSSELTVDLEGDQTAPVILRHDPDFGGATITQLRVQFSERMRRDSVSPGGSLRVWSPGADEQLQTPDDQEMSLTLPEWNAAETEVRVNLALPVSAGLLRVEATSAITDLAGNALAPAQWLLLGGAVNSWQGGFQGNPQQASSWSLGRLPGPEDSVLLAFPRGSPATLYGAWELDVARLWSFADVRWPNGALIRIRDRWDAQGTVDLRAGTQLTGGELRLSGTNRLIVGNRLLLTNLLVRGDVQMLSARLGGDLRVAGTLWLDGGIVEVVQSTSVTADLMSMSGLGFGVAPGASLTLNSPRPIRIDRSGISGSTALDGTGSILRLESDLAVNSAGETVTLAAAQLHVGGRITVSEGARLFVTGSTGVEGGGEIRVERGSARVLGRLAASAPRFASTTNGLLNFDADIDLSGGPLVLSSLQGPVEFSSGSLHGGAIDARGAGAVSIYRTELRAVHLMGSVTLSFESTIRDGLEIGDTVDVRSIGTCTFVGVQTLTGGVLAFERSLGAATVVVPEGSELTLSATTVLRGGNVNITGKGTLINRGRIEASAPGDVVRVACARFVNEGTLAENGGQIIVAPAP